MVRDLHPQKRRNQFESDQKDVHVCLSYENKRPLVDVAALFESLPSSSSLGHPLTSCQVNKAHLAHFLPGVLFTKKHTSMGQTQIKE